MSYASVSRRKTMLKLVLIMVQDTLDSFACIRIVMMWKHAYVMCVCNQTPNTTHNLMMIRIIAYVKHCKNPNQGAAKVGWNWHKFSLRNRKVVQSDACDTLEAISRATLPRVW